MSSTKGILIFQAIITLLIGIAFFWQFISIEAANSTPKELQKAEETKARYSNAAYILLIISLIELIIVIRLVE